MSGLDPAAVASVESPRRSRRGLRWLVAIVILVVLLVVAALIADIAIRAYAEDRVASEIEQQLPPGVEGEVAVEIGGFSVVQQYLAGRFDEVGLRAPELTIDGYPVAASVDLAGVPVEGGAVEGAIESVAGTVDIPQETVAGLIASRGVVGDITLGDDSLQYRTSTEVLGQELGFQVITRPVLDAGRIVFRAESAQIDGAGLEFDATQLLDLVAPEGLSVCVAQYLPEAIELRSVEIVGSEAIVDLTATDLLIDEASLARTGVCN